ncbi:hypothetical protein [Sporomusa sphaeroides]|uniref:HTH cro/C1-type domain-containing protein n=1 Tax=Sporomusa sphaeroides DSM 2875 TaxID=1337886 RepID=A0ABM9W022_9FIRM|nr:hypothetical protein [Sporomusa sphaeroides]OLS56417.1 hypothetical protein SPSPH_28100 [Sporomusa sphaeroides DSM 2875]CVK18512.1 hypothetical protein SSPH_01150 [Sporomusa sphaeroides DSM 2875]
MNDFCEVVKNELKSQGMNVSTFADKMGFSLQYTYNLINRKGDKRWNEDSIQRACEILEIKIQFIGKSA